MKPNWPKKWERKTRDSYHPLGKATAIAKSIKDKELGQFYVVNQMIQCKHAGLEFETAARGVLSYWAEERLKGK